MLSSEARVDSQRIRRGFLGEADWPKLIAAAGRLSEAPTVSRATTAYPSTVERENPGISISAVTSRASTLFSEFTSGTDSTSGDGAIRCTAAIASSTEITERKRLI
jgi:hypothetical protein